MKIVVCLSVLLSCYAYSSGDLTFSGKIKNSQFKKLDGRDCSIVLKSVEPSGASTIAFLAYPKVKGISPLFNKRMAPLKEIQINDLTANYDTHSINRENILVGLGSKYRKEISQRLYVQFNTTMSQIESWQYRDGTETMLGYTYSCE